MAQTSSSIAVVGPGAIGCLFGAMLREAGSTYAPFMVANAAALDSSADEVVCEIHGSEYRQAPFKYQAKCLVWLREAHAALDDDARRTVDEILSGTGCEQLLAGGGP